MSMKTSQIMGVRIMEILGYLLLALIIVIGSSIFMTIVVYPKMKEYMNEHGEG